MKQSLSKNSMLHAIALLLLVALMHGSASAELKPNEVLFLQDMEAFLRDVEEPENAQKLHDRVGAETIKFGNLPQKDTAQTIDGIVTLNRNRLVSRPREQWKYTPYYGGLVFDMSASVLHEMKHQDQGQSRITKSNMNYKIWGEANTTELEGYSVAFSAATRWIEKLRKRLPALPPKEKSQMANYLDLQSHETHALVGDFIGFGYGESHWLSLNFTRDTGWNDSSFEWIGPDGKPFKKEADAKKYLEETWTEMKAVKATADEEVKSGSKTAAPRSDVTKGQDESAEKSGDQAGEDIPGSEADFAPTDEEDTAGESAGDGAPAETSSLPPEFTFDGEDGDIELAEDDVDEPDDSPELNAEDLDSQAVESEETNESNEEFKTAGKELDRKLTEEERAQRREIARRQQLAQQQEAARLQEEARLRAIANYNNRVRQDQIRQYNRARTLQRLQSIFSRLRGSQHSNFRQRRTAPGHRHGRLIRRF